MTFRSGGGGGPEKPWQNLVTQNKDSLTKDSPQSACSDHPNKRLLLFLPLLESVPLNQLLGYVSFSPLQFLHTSLPILPRGLHNLPTLTRLTVLYCRLIADDIWPASLRDVSIYKHPFGIVGRIADHQQLVHLSTHLSFAYGLITELFPSPCDQQLPFLPGLKRYTVNLYDFPLHVPQHIHQYLGAMTALRVLKLIHPNARDMI